MEHALAVRRDLARIGALDQSPASAFLFYLLHGEQEAAISRVLEFLEIAGEAERVRALRPGLFAAEIRARQAAVQLLAEACPGCVSLVGELEPLILERTPKPAEPDPAAWGEMLERLAAATDPYIRAGAVWVSATYGGAIVDVHTLNNPVYDVSTILILWFARPPPCAKGRTPGGPGLRTSVFPAWPRSRRCSSSGVSPCSPTSTPRIWRISPG